MSSSLLAEVLAHPLLPEVLAHPLDDAPRLALAAALTAAGDPRGELVSLQCRLARAGLSPSARFDAKRRVRELVEAHGARWMAGAAGLSPQLRRGFVDEVTGAPDALVTHAAIFASEPVTRVTVLSASADGVAALGAAGVLANAPVITLRGVLGDAGAIALAKALSTRTQPLRSLNLGSAGIEAAGAAALADALPPCAALILTDNGIGDEGLVKLGKSKRLAGTTTLFVTDNDLTDEGIAAFAKGTVMTALARLGVARNWDVTTEGLSALARSKKLKRLRWLEYSDPDESAQRVVVRGR